MFPPRASVGCHGDLRPARRVIRGLDSLRDGWLGHVDGKVGYASGRRVSAVVAAAWHLINSAMFKRYWVGNGGGRNFYFILPACENTNEWLLEFVTKRAAMVQFTNDWRVSGFNSATSVHMLKCPWGWDWTLNCSQWARQRPAWRHHTLGVQVCSGGGKLLKTLSGTVRTLKDATLSNLVDIQIV